jgi:PilZ domain
LYTLFGMTPDAFAVPRRSERKPVRKAIVLMVDEDDLDALHAGMTVDISEHGARVEAEAALAPGQTLNLIQPEDPTRFLRCMVVWAGNVSSDGHDQVGLEFLDPLPADMEN